MTTTSTSSSGRPAGPPLHEAVEPFRFLLGTWRGTGAGSYPTIDSFGYVEEVTFGHVGKPFLAYGQKTRHAETDLPLHAETGYWRPVGPAGSADPAGLAEADEGLVSRIEVVLSHPTGILESLAGTFTAAGPGGERGGVFDLRSDTIARTATAVEVVEVHRRFEIDGDTLRYDVAMAAVGVELTHHLSAVLNRVVG
jgi:hypothetical protein